MSAQRTAQKAKRLSECFASIGTDEGAARLAEYLKTMPYPHYEPAPDSPGYLVKIDANGKRTTGRFVNRKFQAVRSTKRFRKVAVAIGK